MRSSRNLAICAEYGARSGDSILPFLVEAVGIRALRLTLPNSSNVRGSGGIGEDCNKLGLKIKLKCMPCSSANQHRGLTNPPSTSIWANETR
jgi:hypothetical protein